MPSDNKPEVGKCPVDHTAYHKQPSEAPKDCPTGTCPIDRTKQKVPKDCPSGTCPIDHKAQSPAVFQQNEETTKCPVDHSKAKEEGTSCPIDHSGSSKVFDFLSQQINRDKIRIQKEEFVPVDEESEKIDLRNMMPANPKQRPHPQQNFELSTDRVISNIPKSDAEDNWVYPSPQMFFNAVKRKGGEADEDSMKSVIFIHNAVNEYCWQKILEWEDLHETECKTPKLSRFQGRFSDLSPKSRLKMMFGWERPFDRHDWVVDRCGKEVRYIIDYYNTGKPNDEIGGLDIHLDVRPALDNAPNWWDRVKMLFK